MSKQSKKLSERLEALNLDGTTVGWEDCQRCESIIEAVRELEDEVERLKEELTLAREGGELFRQSQYRVEELHLVAIRERDEARAELRKYQNECVEVHDKVMGERDAAIRERDEARAEIERLWKTDANQGWKYWQKRFYDLFDEHKIFVSECNAAEAKFAAVREWAENIEGFESAYGLASEVHAILDGAPVAADTEVVTREVVLGRTRDSYWTVIDAKEMMPEEVNMHYARATITFHVPKPKVEKKCACGARHWSEGEGIGLMELCTCKQSKTELETLAAEIRHGREVADAREVYLQKKCAHKYGFRYSGASGGCDPWSVYKCIMCNFETVSPGNLDKDWEKRVKKPRKG